MTKKGAHIMSSLLVATLLSVMAGCGTSECYENHSALPLAGFYSATGQAVTVRRLTVFGIGAPGDSVLYYDQTMSEAYVPFRIDRDTTTFVLAYMAYLEEGQRVDINSPSIPKDTIDFIYERKPWFVNPACGAMYFYDMKDVKFTRHLLDSISTEPVITNQNSVNIKIFFNE